MEHNPYEAVNIDLFKIMPVGRVGDQNVFHICTSERPAFDAVVFRDHLVRFLFSHARDSWNLGNNGQPVDFGPDDLCLALSDRDADRFRSYGWLVGSS